MMLSRAAPLLLLAVAALVAGFGAFLAAGAGTSRADVALLNVRTASALRADYGADKQDVKRAAPLLPGIIEDAAADRAGSSAGPSSTRPAPGLSGATSVPASTPTNAPPTATPVALPPAAPIDPFVPFEQPDATSPPVNRTQPPQEPDASPAPSTRPSPPAAEPTKGNDKDNGKATPNSGGENSGGGNSGGGNSGGGNGGGGNSGGGNGKDNGKDN